MLVQMTQSATKPPTIIGHQLLPFALGGRPPKPPPLPPEEGKPAEWMPLGVFALAQEEKGDPVMLFQLSINREGVITGGCESTLTGDQKAIAGSVNKKTQDVAWRIGENKETVYATSLGNLTRDVSPITIHFADGQVQTWLMVRLPPPAEAGQEAAIPQVDSAPPPATPIPVAAKAGQAIPPPEFKSAPAP